jgi:tRNA(adenine34) deaminase
VEVAVTDVATGAAVPSNFDDVALLRAALEQAREAQRAGDHPYGSVVVAAVGTVSPSTVSASTVSASTVSERNRVESTPDPSAHSEVMALRTAALAWGLAGLTGATLVTSFEPCPMCLGAILEAGIARLVIGGRRVVGEPPLGDYSVEALLAMLGRTGDLVVETHPLAEITAFYA